MKKSEAIQRIQVLKKEFDNKITPDMLLNQAYEAVGIKQASGEIKVTGRKAVDLFYQFLLKFF